MSGSSLPSIIKAWERKAESQGVLETSVHKLLEVASASKIGLKQYYSLRVLWKVIEKELPDANILGFSKDDPVYRTASDYLKKSQSWQDYLANVSSGPLSFSANRVRDIGAFSNVLYYQLHVEPVPPLDSADDAMDLVPSKFSPRRAPVARSVSIQPEAPSLTTSRGRPAVKKSSYLDPDYSFDDTLISDNSFAAPSPQSPITTAIIAPSEDEQIVNIALILWLQTLIMFHPHVQLQRLKWSVKRLKFDFGEWEARTDGCLRKDREVKAIVEVKPYARTDYVEAIQKQESAQMASWIRNSPFDGGWHVVRDGCEFERRLLVSQDSVEIYLAVAEFDSTYRNYLYHENQDGSTERSFMTMYQYGPWKTSSKEHMEQLGKLLLAFTLRFCQSRDDSFKTNPESPTTLSALEELGVPRTPTPSAAPKNPLKAGKTVTNMASKRPAFLGKGTDRAGASAPPKKPGMGKEKAAEVTETSGAAGMTGTTRRSKTSENPAPPAKSSKLKTKEAETTEEPAPFEQPKIDTTETDEIVAPTEPTRVTQKPTSSKQSGKGKGKMTEPTKGTKTSGSSTATTTTESTQKTLPSRGSRKLKDKEAE